MAASFVSLVDEWRLQAPFAVEADPQLTLSPAIAQNFRGLLNARAAPRLQKSEHLTALAQVGVPVALFEGERFFFTLLDEGGVIGSHGSSLS